MPAATTAPVVAATPPPTPAPDAPVVPESREPIEAQLGSVKRLFDAGAAVFVDARTAGEYAEGHIPGAMNIPYDDVFRDPDRLKGFSSNGRPVVVYCGGGDCELSRNLAWALVEEGEKRVLVFLGGTAEWQRAGYPMSSGGTP
jgi:rhodanese-related sulfurtransferase